MESIVQSPRDGAARAPAAADGAAAAPHVVAVIVAMFGAAFMAAISANLLLAHPDPYIGAHLYDLYAKALSEGRFDLPALDLRYEGHFAPDGTGYLYYGLGPLLMRLPFLPFVDMPTTWISALSIWLWAVAGNVCLHRAAWLALAQGAGGTERIGNGASALLAVTVWFASPGLLLVGGGAVFHEPIAMAYALGCGFVLLLAMVIFGTLSLERAIVPLALLAGLCVHARPNLAVGYYAAVCLIALGLVLRGGSSRWKAAIGALLVLGLFGGILLASNAVRFGNIAAMHGSFERSELQYASAFWGLESPDGKRGRAFAEHGRFNPQRIAPNALVYFASPPSDLGMDAGVAGIERAHVRMLAPSDFVNISEPRAGALFLWPGWILLMAIGLARREAWRMPAIAGLAGAAGSTLLLLSYPTITLRYHVDLWPLIALPAMLGVAALARWFARNPGAVAVAGTVLVALVAAGTAVTLHKTAHSRAMNRDPGAEWTADFCRGLAANKGFDARRGDEICGIGSR